MARMFYGFYMVSELEYNPLFNVEVDAGHGEMTMPLWTRRDKEILCLSLPTPGILFEAPFLQKYLCSMASDRRCC